MDSQGQRRISGGISIVMGVEQGGKTICGKVGPVLDV